MAKKPEFDVQDRWGYTSLMQAIELGDEAKALQLIGEAHDLNAQNKQGETALYLAVRSGNKAVIKALIENGVDVNKADRWGVTPLMVSAYHGNPDVSKLLIKAGADLDAQDENGQTAADYVAAARNRIMHLKAQDSQALSMQYKAKARGVDEAQVLAEADKNLKTTHHLLETMARAGSRNSVLQQSGDKVSGGAQVDESVRLVKISKTNQNG